MRAHYDFSGGVRGKYAKRFTEGANVVVLDPDVAKVFPDGRAVNETLRAVARIVDLRLRSVRRLTNASGVPRSNTGATKKAKVRNRGSR